MRILFRVAKVAAFGAIALCLFWSFQAKSATKKPMPERKGDIGIQYMLEPTLQLIFVGNEQETKRVQIKNTGKPVRIRVFEKTYFLGANDWTEFDPPNTDGFIVYAEPWTGEDDYRPLFARNYDSYYIISNFQPQKNQTVDH